MLIFRKNMNRIFRSLLSLLLLTAIPSSLGISTVLDDFQLSNIRQSDDGFRLSPLVHPVNYKLELMVILDPLDGQEMFTAPAREWITVAFEEETSILTLHALNLTINDGTIAVRNVDAGTNVQVTQVSYSPEYDFLHISFSSPAQAGQKYEVSIEFVTPISSDRLNGMYLDFYDDPVTEERNYIATTLFAPYHARRAFPCFDEPSFRATYDITIGHSTKYHAMSNADIIASRPIDNMTDWVWDTFDTTPSMSSYIVAMIVSNLNYFEAQSESFRNVTVRVYAKPTSIEQGAAEYSAKLTGDVMTYFESLFIESYPISKIYSVALPQFFFSAMENWGLITYKEPVLLYIPGETTEDERYRINSVLSHEKAHQHFGNIIACNWWSYVWLKEGFATFFSHYGINHTNPELSPWEQFIPKVLQVAMDFDSTNATHPLENFPPTSAAVAEIYTRIPYEKGASILRMTSFILTEPVFLAAIRDYVDTFKYSNATQYDLFEALQRAVDASVEISSLLPTTVKAILDTWTTQAGFPVIQAISRDSTTLEITQQKFIDGDETNPTDTWWVPIFISPRPNPSLPVDFPDLWIPQGARNITINMTTDQLIIINPGSIGYYRVLYDSSLIQRIREQLRTDHTKVPTVARSQLLNDYFHFAMTGLVDIETTLELISYMSKEIDIAVWLGVYPLIDRLEKKICTTEYYETLKKYFGNMANQALARLKSSYSTEDLEKGEKAICASLLSYIACKFSTHECLVNSKFWIDKWIAHPEENKIPLNTQEAVYCGASQDKSNWNFLLKMYKEVAKSGHFSPNTMRLAKGMTCSKNETHLKELLLMITSETSEIPKSDKFDVLYNLVNNPIGKDLILEELNRSSDWFFSLFKSQEDLRMLMAQITSYDLMIDEIDTLRTAAENSPSTFRSMILAFTEQKQACEDQFFELSSDIKSIGQWLQKKQMS